MIAESMKQGIISSLLLAAFPILAQLQTPNHAGVSAGHDVLRGRDVEAANKFWQALGGEPVQFAGRLNLIKFPGVLLLTVGSGQGPGKAAPNPPPVAELAGSEGSSLDFIGFSVKDLKRSLAIWADAGSNRSRAVRQHRST